MIQETKPALKTTELWGGVAAIVATILAFDTPDVYKLGGVVIIVGAYIVSRGLAKNGIPAETVAPFEDVAIEDEGPVKEAEGTSTSKAIVE